MTDQRQKHDPRSVTTFPQFIRATADAYGDAPAFVLEDETGTETISFVEVERRSAALARGLIASGVGKGSRIGFIAANGPEFAVLFAAICRVGAVAIPVSTLIKANELIRVLQRSDVAGLITQRSILGHDLVGRLCDALPGLTDAASPDLRLPEVPYLRWIACTSTGDLPASFRSMDSFTALADSVDEALLARVEENVSTTDQMIEIYTSGSMALPKGVKHNHGPSMARVHYLADMAKLEPGMTVRATQPMFWIGGLGFTMLPNWERGVTTLCTEKTSTNSRRALGSVLAAEDLQAAPDGTINWSIGMTETFGPYAYSDVLRVPGYPLTSPLDHFAPGYDVRLWIDGREAAEGERGEIQVRGYAVTPALHKVEQDVYFEADGFYRTGDMGVREGARIHFVGRAGDMIKTANANVSPAEVEMELQQIEGVESAYVVGLPDQERGQLVVAAVVPREGATLDFAGIEATLKKSLSSFKVPRQFVAITRAEVPMLPTNKVSRRDIERLMAAKLGRDAAGANSTAAA